MNKKANSTVLSICALLACAFLSTAHAAPSYTLIDLGTAGASSSRATRISDNGQVTGWLNSFNSNGWMVQNAFIWSNGSMTKIQGLALGQDINDSGWVVGSANPWPSNEGIWKGSNVQSIIPPGSNSSQIFQINNSGQAVGTSNNQQGFIWNGGQFQVLNQPGSSFARALAINNLGDAAGVINNRPVVWHNLNYTYLGSQSGQSHAINDHDMVVGSLNDGNYSAQSAFLWDGANMVNLGNLLPGKYSDAQDINNNGQVVGYSFTSYWAPDTWSAVLWDHGIAYDLESITSGALGWNFAQASGINSLGQIVGTGINPQGQQHAFLLSPNQVNAIPEPETYALLLAGLGLIGAMAKRRRVD